MAVAIAPNDSQPHRRKRFRIRELTAKQLASIGALVALLASVACGIVGIISSPIWFEAAVLAAISTGLGYFVIASRESAQATASITDAINSASEQSNQTLMAMASQFGKLTPIPVPDHVFRHASYAMGSRSGKGDWQRIYLYAPVGVWMESRDKDEWLTDLIAALERGTVKQCWGVYGLPPRSKAAAWHAHGVRRLTQFINADHTELHYLPAEDDSHPGAARGQGIIVLESADTPADYTTIFLFIGDNTESRGGFMIEDQVIGKIMAKWFESQVFDGCSAKFMLRPEEDYKNKTPAQYMEDKLAEISTKYPNLAAA